MNNAVSTVNQRKSRVQPEQQGGTHSPPNISLTKHLERVVVYIRLRPFLKRELENP